MSNSILAGQLAIFDIPNIPVMKVKRKLSKKEMIELNYLKEDLLRREHRLNDLIMYGDAACSKYDLSMGYNAEFNIRLVKNQINYSREKIAELEEI